MTRGPYDFDVITDPVRPPPVPRPAPKPATTRTDNARVEPAEAGGAGK